MPPLKKDPVSAANTALELITAGLTGVLQGKANERSRRASLESELQRRQVEDIKLASTILGQTSAIQQGRTEEAGRGERAEDRLGFQREQLAEGSIQQAANRRNRLQAARIAAGGRAGASRDKAGKLADLFTKDASKRINDVVIGALGRTFDKFRGRIQKGGVRAAFSILDELEARNPDDPNRGKPRADLMRRIRKELTIELGTLNSAIEEGQIRNDPAKVFAAQTAKRRLRDEWTRIVQGPAVQGPSIDDATPEVRQGAAGTVETLPEEVPTAEAPEEAKPDVISRIAEVFRPGTEESRAADAEKKVERDKGVPGQKEEAKREARMILKDEIDLSKEPGRGRTQASTVQLERDLREEKGRLWDKALKTATKMATVGMSVNQEARRRVIATLESRITGAVDTAAEQRIQDMLDKKTEQDVIRFSTLVDQEVDNIRFGR